MRSGRAASPVTGSDALRRGSHSSIKIWAAVVLAALLVAPAVIGLMVIPTIAQTDKPLPVINPTPAGIPEKFEEAFYEKILKTISKRSDLRSFGTTLQYYTVVVVVERYGPDGTDVSEMNKARIVEELKEAGAKDIASAETLSFVIALVPVGKIMGLSTHEDVHLLGDGQLPLRSLASNPTVTVNATVAALTTANGIADGSGARVAILESTNIDYSFVNDKIILSLDCSSYPCIPASRLPSSGLLHADGVAHFIGTTGHAEHNGISPGAEIISLASGGYSDGQYYALDWAVSNDVDVVNMSIAVPSYCSSSSAQFAVNVISNDVVLSGTTLVSSAGNQGPGYESLTFPCSYNIITVGGIDDRGSDITMSSFASRGPYHIFDYSTLIATVMKPEIVAPATNVPIAVTVSGVATGNSGTSFSAPQVSAAVAVLAGENDYLSPEDVRATLFLGANWTGPVPCTSVQFEQNNTADDCSYARQPSDANATSTSILNNVGFGILNVGQSLHYTLQGNGQHVVAGDLLHDDVLEYQFNITNTARPVKVILTWLNNAFNAVSVPGETPTVFTSGRIYNLDLEVTCPGMDAIHANSAYQNNEFAVFMPNQTGTCTVQVDSSDSRSYDSRKRFALASTIPFNVEPTSPRISVTSPVNATVTTLTVDFGNAIKPDAFTASDVTTSTGTVSEPTTSDSQTFGFNITNPANEDIEISIAAGTVEYVSGNINAEAHARIERAPPTVVLSTIMPSPTNAKNAPFTAAFSEPVAFDSGISDISVTGGAASNLSPSGTSRTFTFIVTPTGDGKVTVSIPAGSVADLAGNTNTVSNTLQITFKMSDPEAFITTWKTTTADESITLPISGSGMTVNWGDGTTTTASGPVSHTYNTAGDHTIQITGELTRFHLINAAYASKLVSLDQWGTASWTTMENAFRGASNMAYNAVDSPDLSSVTDMYYMFSRASAFNGNISSWNVSSVTDMSYMFFHASAFNGDLSSWNVSSVTDMSYMFASATSFNGDLSSWNVSSVTDMSYMFFHASAFNGDLSSWNVSSVTDMSNMFRVATSFNGNISSWDVSSVTDMYNMFASATSFNGDLSSWNVSSVTNMFNMFRVATSFNGDLSSWNVSSVIDMNSMFRGASSFNQTLNSWDVSSVTNMSNMFNMFNVASAFNGNISSWDVSSVTNMFNMFRVATSFNGDLSSWNVSSVIKMNSMFRGASSFNQTLNDWDVSSVSDMDNMFQSTRAFNQPLNSWNVSSVTDMYNMFHSARAFNQPLNSWNVSSVTDMYNMFSGASSFDQNLGNWYVVPDSVSIASSNVPGVVGSISAQNTALNSHNPVYNVTGSDSTRFAIVNGNQLNMASVDTESDYTVNVTASDGTVFEDGNNWRVLEITVSGGTNGSSVVMAGDDQTVGEGDTVTLSGSVTPDGDPITYAWSQTAPASPLIAFANSSAPLTTFTAPAITGDTTFTITLTAHDGTQSAEDTLKITVKETSAAFITTWTATSSDKGITLPMKGTYSVLWGDDSYDAGVRDSKLHTYADAGTYTVTVLGEGLESISLFSDNANALQLESIEQWGGTEWTTMDDAFEGASNMVYRATNAPDLSKVTHTSGMFWGASSFDGDLSGWNVSNVTNMFGMFSGASSFNQTLNSWDVSSVTDMSYMFFGASSFDQPLNSWDVSSVTDIYNMFERASSFNQPLNGWNVSSATAMSNMFDDATAFNQNLGNWYVVPDSVSIASSNVPGVVGSISAQNTALDGHSPVYNVTGSDPTRFTIVNGNQLNMTSVDNTKSDYTVNVTASGGSVFEDGNNWRVLEITVSGSTNDPPMVQAGDDQTVGEGDTVTLSGSVTPDGDPITYAWSQTAPASPLIAFANSSAPLTTFTAPAITGDTTFTITLTAHDGTQSAADALNVTVRETGAAFITTWTASDSDKGITLPMKGTYSVLWGDDTYSPDVINSKLYTYDVAGTYTVTVLGEGLESINLSSYDAPNAEQLRSIEQWGGTKWTTMSGAFDGAANMVYRATDAPDLSGVTYMDNMFLGASSFNGNLSGWNVSSVIDMSSMFDGASSFNGNLSGWDVSSVTNMNYMFWDASSFDQPLNNWNVSSVTSMFGMFNGASSFDQNLGNWYVVPADTVYANSEGTLNVTTISTQNTALDVPSLLYGIDSGDSLNLFNITGSNTLMFKSAQSAGTYNVTVTASGTVVFSNGNNWRILNVTVTGGVTNAVPELNSIGSQSVSELQSLTFTATATDANSGDTLMFSLTGTTPSGASIHQDTGVFSWTPSESQDGTHTITVRVEDGAGAIDSEAITVTVNEVNEDPVLNSIGPKSANQLEQLTFTATATDGDTIGGTADTLAFSMTNAPTGASINQNTGVFSWTPTASQTGAYTITFQVQDGAGATDSENVTVTVTVSNQNPVLGSIGSKSVDELATLSFNATATDGNNDALEFSLTGTPPSGASINSTSGAFSWTPTELQDGSHSVTVRVSDGNGGSDSETITVTVNEVNEDPVLASVGSKQVNELAALSFTASASDGDTVGGTADTLEFSLTGTTPSGASIHQDTGVFSWTPSESQDGTHTITVRVEDGNGGSDSEAITVTVDEVNEDPVLASVGSKQVNELAALSFTASASDGDTVGGTADTLEFSLTGTTPSGASIHQDTGVFSWTPSESQDGTHTITVRVEDGAGAIDSEAITVTVNEVNEDPVLNSIGPKSANQLEQLTFTATATDGDTIGGTADTLAFSMTNAPTGASINQNTGVFSWTPTASQTGAYTITFQVQDGAGATDSENVTVTVTVSNQNPVLGSIGSKSVDELATLSFNATATDGNNDALEFSLTGTPPSGASINSTSGAFSWTPTELQDGSHSVTVRVSDGNGGSDSETITVTVNEVNEDPVLASVGSKQVNELAALSFTASASDGDTVGGTADTLEFSLTGTTPSGASIHQDTGVFSWTPSESQDGTHTITVRVEDGNGGSDSEAITVTVDEVNEDPVLASVGSKQVNELAALSFTASASDGDTIGGTADTLEFSLTGTTPSGASINQNTGVFSWTPSESQDGTHTITVRVEDDNGGSDSEAITVTVNEVNEDPVLASVGSKQVNELAALSFTASASDGDTVGGTADTLEFSLTGTTPSGASIHQDTGVFSWTPSESQDGTHTITVRVEDGNGGSDSEAITVTVNEVNEDPVLASVGSKQVNELAALSFTASASDGDTIGGTADTLEFSLTGTTPSGASIHQDTGVFSWTPSESQDGTHTITVRVEDGAGAIDSEAITVTVNEVNEDPVLASVGSKQVNELAALSFTASASDGDTVGGTADTLEFSLTGTTPSGASIHQDTGVFSWTPSESQDGTHTITVRVEDDNGGSDSEAITVTVDEVNEDPVLASVGSKQVNELAALSFTASASDGDTIGGTADTLEFSLTGTTPSGASIHQDTGVFSWTPSESQDGTHTITVRVEDGAGAIDSEAITVTVNEVNEDPVLASVGSKQVNELAALSFTASASDGDTIGGTADTLEFSLTGTTPSGASIHQDTGVFSWTPSESQDGTHTITVRVEDGNGGSDSEAITVTVNEVNEDPVLNSIGPKSANQLEQLTFTATATDGDTIGGTADTLAFSMTNAPTGASINQNTGVFSWTPTASQTGAYTITFQVQDGAGATDSENVTVTVTVSNQNPVLGSIGSKSVDELATLSFNATATDGNNDALEFSLTGTPPSGASINSTSGAFSWTPTELQDGSHSVTVRVSDGNGGSDSETITVTVNEVNEDPVLASVGSKQVNELAALSFTASASDGDTVGGTADTLEFSLTGTTPSGASIHQDTGVFSWTPSESQDGTHTITVRVEDGNGGSDSEAITVTVDEVNEDPVLASVGSKQVNELAALSFTASASDGDTIGGTADTLEFSLTGTTPSGASIHQDTGVFSWTPSESQDGTHTITVRVEDGAGAIDSEAITVTVNEVNEDPVLASVGSKQVNELAALSFTASASDGDTIGGTADTLEFSLTGTTPSGASIHQDTGVFSWTPSESQDGTHTITVRVEDGNGGSDSEAITVTVNEVNEDPVLNSIGPKSANQLEQLTFTATATDGDTIGGTADTLAFSMTNAPTGASINQNTGVFSWTPTASQTGAYTITFQVQDGAGATDSENVTVTVTVSNQNPVLGSIGSKSVDELATLSFNATATDGNNDALEFSLTGTPPSGASINSTSGAFSWTPTELQDGSHSVTVRVSDGNGGSDSETITVTVNEVNEDPVLASVGSKQVNELAALSFTASASDGDTVGGTADTLEFSLTGTTPSGASIHQDTGVFSWTPSESQDGTHTITVRVEDGNGGSDSETITVTVDEVNEDPVLASVGSKQVNELAALSFTASASDADTIGGTADTLEFSLTGTTPSGASIHQDTGVFSWTPSESQDGTHTITVRVEDGAGAIDSEAITVTVNEVNEDPVLASVGSKQVNELAALSFTASASDGDTVGGTADTLEFSLTGTTPSGASIHQDTGVFSWTPSESQDGTYTITVRVEDGNGGSDSEAITVTVDEVNEDPVLNSIGPKSANPLETLSFTASASDADIIGGTADTLEFSLTGTPPTGASINQNTGVFSWTPTASQTGAYTITFQVQDGAGATDSEDVTVTVTVSNQNPVLGSIGSKSVDELATLSFNATATDGNNDALEFSLTGTPPSGASINSTSGAFSWTPTELQDGSHSVTVRVSDGNGGSDSESITVTVNEVNEDPVLASVGSKQVNELAALSFTASASDGDTVGGTADTLEFSLTGTTPSGASIHQDTGVFSWTPSESQDGTHTITVRVEDGNGGSDSETITVTVDEVNEDPVLNSIGPKSANQLEQLTFTATATDGDTIGGTADTLEFSLTGTPPTGASINQNTGVFSWTPTASQTGAYTITFQVQDGAGATDSEDVTVTVTVSNQNPVLGSIGSKSVDELATLSFNATATDGNNDALEFSLTGTPPSGASINSTSGAFSWTPTELQDGSHSVTVRVSDGNGGSDSETITVTVNEVNEDPVLASVGSKQVNELAALSFTASASDGDTVGGTADTLEFSLTGTTPSGASIHQDTGVFSWTPSESQDGTHTITVRVEDDNGGSDSEAITVTVNEVNEDPVLNSIGPKSANQLEQLTFTATATDGDTIGGTADTLEFSLTGTPPTGASINQNTGVFSWTPTASQTVAYAITFQVQDGDGATDSETVTVTVSDSNENPVLNSIGLKSVNELATLSFTASATDGDSDSLTFSLVGAPSGTLINQNTGAFSWTPTELQDGSHSATVRVSDGNGGTDSETVTVTVGEVNTAPVLGSIGPQGVNRPGTLTFTATAVDGDVIAGVSDTMTFSMTGAPTGASVDSVTGAFSWTPAESQTGMYTITVRVEDGSGASDSENVTVTVTEGGTNEVPVLDFIGPQEINELETLEFTATATDNDMDSLTFVMAGDRPRGASMTPSGMFSWTPDQSQDGDYSITVRVSDGRGGTDSEVVAITVRDIAPLPVSARASSSSAIALTLSEIVVSGGQGPNGFSVTTGGDPVSVQSITGSGTTTLVLGLDGTVSSTDGAVRLSYSDAVGDVEDMDGRPLASFSELDVLFSSQRRGGTTPPAVDLGTLAYQRLADIPPHIAEQIASRDASDPLEPLVPDDTFEFPLVINGYGYLLDDTTTTLVPQILTVGGDDPIIVTFTVYTQKDPAHFTLYLNLSDENTDYADSDTYITYKNNDGTTVVTDPHEYIGSATITVTQEDDQIPEKKTVRITVEFAEPMGLTNMVAYMWNTDRKAAFIKIIDAFEVVAVLPEPVVQAADPEPVEPDSELPADPEPAVPGSGLPADPEPASADTTGSGDYDEAQVLTLIRMWSGFEPEMITDEQMLASLGLDYHDADIPNWMMTELGVLVAKGDVTVDEFMLALQYVLDHA